MRQLLLFSLSASLVAAIWPIPVTYEHGDTVLFVKRDVPFYWYEAGARNVGSMVDQAPFIFSSNSNTNSDPQDISTLKLRKRYTEPSLSDDAVTGSQEGVSGDKIIEFAINSTWNTIFKQNLYPWKFHPRNWSEPSPSGGNTTYVSRINIKVLSTDPPNIAKPLAGEVDESYRLTLTEEGLATISANTSVGVARGLTTLTQLLRTL
jgi:hexosaminidase